MSVNDVLVLLSRFAKYPVIALISIVVGIVSYDFTNDIVKAVGFSLIFIGLPLLLMALIDIGMYGMREYIVKRIVDSSAITLLGLVCINKQGDLRVILLMFLLIVISWALIRKGIEYAFRESKSGFVIIDFNK